MKDVAKWMPGIGWMFIFMEFPFLKRSWKDDETRLAASCRNLADYPNNMLVSRNIKIFHCDFVLWADLI